MTKRREHAVSRARAKVDLLLVEDDPHDLELTLLALERHSLSQRVHVARDGEEALLFLFGTDPPWAKPRLVLLDLKLPKVDGLEVLERIRADERTKHVPVVVLSSSSEERDVAESYRRGSNSYVVKPVDSGKFSATVGQLGLYWLGLNHTPPS